MRRSQGAQANANGKTAEVVIDAVLSRKRLPFVPQYIIGPGIYGTPIKVDFYIPTAPKFPNGLVIEAKWQESSGSADEKLPYLWLNIEHCFPCPAIVVIDGAGFREEAIAWLRSRVGGNLAAVYNLQEFVSWCNRSL